MWSKLELKIPPLVLMAISAALMYLSAWLGTQFWPLQEWHFSGAETVALALVAFGVVVAMAGVLKFRKAGTTVHPVNVEQTATLVQSGIYRFTRNPMYLGFLLILVGWALWLEHPLTYPWVIGFVIYLNRFQIAPEERWLEQKFGSQFIDYCQQVRRWF